MIDRDQYDNLFEFSKDLEIGREEFPQQGNLIKVLTQTESVRYLIIFDTDLSGTCNENAIRRIEYDYSYYDGTKLLRAADEVSQLLNDLEYWFEELGIEPFSVVAAPWELRDLSRFDEEEEAYPVVDQIRDVEAGVVHFIQHPQYSNGYIDFDMNISRTDLEEKEENLVYQFRICVLEDRSEARGNRDEVSSEEQVPVTIFGCRKETSWGSWEEVKNPLDLPLDIREKLRANTRAFIDEVQSRLPGRDVTLIGDTFGFSEVVSNLNPVRPIGDLPFAEGDYVAIHDRRLAGYVESLTGIDDTWLIELITIGAAPGESENVKLRLDELEEDPEPIFDAPTSVT